MNFELVQIEKNNENTPSHVFYQTHKVLIFHISPHI